MANSTYSGPYLGPQGPVSLSARQQLAEQIVGVVQWSEDGAWGYCACPGAAFHTGKTAKRDCRIFTGLRGEAQEAPSVYCLHTSCLAAVEAAQTRFRSVVGKAKVAAARSLPPTPSKSPESVRQVRTTARTGNFGLAEEKRGSSQASEPEVRTARTAEPRPLTRFAHVRAHPHVSVNPTVQPSEPYVKSETTKQPEPQKVAQQTPDMNRGSCPVDATKRLAERPGDTTWCMKGEPCERVIEGPDGPRVLFKFKSQYD